MIPLPFIRLFALSNALFWHFQPSVFSGSPPLAACDKPIKPSSAKSACITFPVFRTLFLTFCPRQAHKRPFASIFAHVSSRFVRRRGRREIFPPFARYIPIYSLYHYCVMIIKINTGIPEGKKERTNPSANKPSFLVLAHRQVRQMSDVRSVSTIGNYKTALRSLERFLTIEGMSQAPPYAQDSGALRPLVGRGRREQQHSFLLSAIPTRPLQQGRREPTSHGPLRRGLYGQRPDPEACALCGGNKACAIP